MSEIWRTRLKNVGGYWERFKKNFFQYEEFGTQFEVSLALVIRVHSRRGISVTASFTKSCLTNRSFSSVLLNFQVCWCSRKQRKAGSRARHHNHSDFFLSFRKRRNQQHEPNKNKREYKKIFECTCRFPFQNNE